MKVCFEKISQHFLGGDFFPTFSRKCHIYPTGIKICLDKKNFEKIFKIGVNDMIIARLHRGGIYESMETAKTFETVQEMKQWFVDKHDKAFSVDDVVIDESITFDDRIKWNTQYVCTERYMDKDYMELYGSPQCIGMCDMNYTQK